MSNEYFQSSGIPATRSPGVSAPIRSEFNDIEVGFDKMPVLTGNASKVVVVNAGATALTTVAALGPPQGGTGTATAFQEGSVIFAGASGVYSQNNTNFVWSNTGLSLGIGATVAEISDGFYGLLIKKPISLPFSSGIRVNSEIRPTPLFVQNFESFPTFSATPFVLPALTHFGAGQGTINGATITNQYGFSASGTLIGAANNYGFYSVIAAGTGRWNFYAAGTANNAYAGNTRFGGVTVPTVPVDVTGSILASVEVKAPTVFASGTGTTILKAGTGISNGQATDGFAVSSVNDFGTDVYAATITTVSDEFTYSTIGFNTSLGTPAAPTDVTNGVPIGGIEAKGWLSPVYSTAAAIDFTVAAAPGTHVPGQIRFRIASATSSAGTMLSMTRSGIYGNLTLNPFGVVAAGSADQSFIKGGSTANFGIFYGTGAPTFTAVANSLYVRRDGVVNARLYINTTGSTTWTALATLA